MEKKTVKTSVSKKTSTTVKNVEESIYDSPKIKEFEAKLFELRKDGVLKINALQEEISSIKKNKMVDEETRKSIIAKDNEALVKAKEIRKANQQEVNKIVKEAVAHINEIGKKHEKEFSVGIAQRKIDAKKEHEKTINKLNEEHKANLNDINSKFVGELSKEQILEKKTECKNEDFAYKSAIYDENGHYTHILKGFKDEVFSVYNERRSEIKRIRNGALSFKESIENKWKNYVYQFEGKKFLLSNALYIVIGIFFVFCCIYAPISGVGNLLSVQNILNILETSSTRMFYALGVAGLILIAGTDLSIGRMVALGSITTAVILHNGDNIITFFGQAPMNFDAIPMFVRVILAIVLSIVFCTAFSMIAGFFTAKFKMHPFISTLSTQLIIYGLLFFATSGVSAGSIDSGIKDLIGGRWLISGTNITIPKLIVPAIIIIFVVWFIWNKTKFGKNMYAVGGNAEAASVSGINVFWVTMGIFILAGVCYGFGSFLEAFRANTSAGTGQGFELDAIAACVVGGISFSGGVGKVKGAVIGVIIFTALTYALTFLNIDTNLQFVFKGVIILSAVALDCLKYLKKK